MKFSTSQDEIPVGHAGMDARLKLGPRIHQTAYVVRNATVIGDVMLMEESSVWYGAVLRGDLNRIIIGPRSNVQDNAVVHIDTPNEMRLGELVTVGHSAIVHACTIDDEVLIGMGAIVLDGSEIGARSHHRGQCPGNAGVKNSARFPGARFAGKSKARAHARGTKRHCALGLELCRNLKAFP